MGKGFGPLARAKKFGLDKKLKICYNNNTKEKGKKFPKKFFKNLLTNTARSAIIKVQRKREVIKMKELNVTINFDMDGTIADLYGVENWLEYLINGDAFPYANAKPMVKMNVLARKLNELQRNGYRVAIISWLSKSGTDEYNEIVTKAKMEWLKKHLASVHFDHIDIIAYGTPKQNGRNGILFDDEEPNRNNWNGIAYDVNNIIEVLRAL